MRLVGSIPSIRATLINGNYKHRGFSLTGSDIQVRSSNLLQQFEAPVKFAFGYGSGVFRQGQQTKSNVCTFGCKLAVSQVKHCTRLTWLI